MSSCSNSFSPGLEKEVIFMTFQQYTLEPSTWFLSLVDNVASLQTSGCFLIARSISSDHLGAMKKLGALCALLLINGQCPDPFNPLVFQYLIHNFDLHLLYERLVGEWRPELRTTIRNWINMGETGDVTPFWSHFASYHNQSVRISCPLKFFYWHIIQLGFLHIHNCDMHEKIGVECSIMLFLVQSLHRIPSGSLSVKDFHFHVLMDLISVKWGSIFPLHLRCFINNFLDS